MKRLKRNIQTKIKDFFVYNIPDFFHSRSKLFWFIHLPIIIMLVVVFIGSVLYVKWYINWTNKKDEVFNQLKAFKHHIMLETNDEYRRRYGSIGIGTRLRNFGFPSKIYDINGREIGEFSEERRIYVKLEEVSPLFIKSLLITEDTNFMEHHGVDYKAMLRAAFHTIVHFSRQGGSTITQQLAKLLFTQREISIKRKIFEMFCAKVIERNHTKEEILLMYVNLIYFGHGANGIEYASKMYFDKKAANLNIGEAAFLSGIILNPTYFSPFRNKRVAKARHLRVLKRIQEVNPSLLGGKTAKQVYREFWTTHVFNRDSIQPKFILKSNYAPYVIETVRRELIKRVSAEDLLRGGYKIYTTIDIDLQKAAKEELQRGIMKWRKTLKKSWKYKKLAKDFQGALISIDPKTSQIKALVGGYEFVKKNQLNRVYQAKRQVGSAFKPITYLSALDLEAITPWTLISDRPLKMKVRGPTGRMEDWIVHNGINKYMMDIPASKALEISSNVAAVRVLRKVGVSRLRTIVKRALGLTDSEAERRFPNKVWSIALGTSDMTPYEVATVYSAVANNGYAIKPYLIRKVIDSYGNEIYKVPDDYGRNGDLIVNHRESIYLVRGMMRQVVAGEHGTGGAARRYCNFEFVGKTGSSQGHRDMWFIGFTNELCTVTWFGHDQNKSLALNMYGGTVAAPVWGKYMKQASKYINFTPFRIPPGLNLVRLRIDKYSGLVAREDQKKGVVRGLFIAGTEPGDYSDWRKSRRKWFFLSPEELRKREQGGQSAVTNRNNEPDEIHFENNPTPSNSNNTNNSNNNENNRAIRQNRRHGSSSQTEESSPPANVPMD